MTRKLETLGARLLSLVVPSTNAAACACWYTKCPDGSPRECCKIGGRLYCEPC